jgi:Flp pilus assembly pilin Flp
VHGAHRVMIGVCRIVQSELRRLIHDEEGQATVEYILILSVSVVGAGAIGRAVLGTMDRGIQRLGAVLERDLKTGRQPLGVWEN